MDFEIREATTRNGDALLVLLPRLAAFPKPDYRSDPEIYRTDERVLRRWLDGDEPNCRVVMAEDMNGALLGFALLTLRPEVLSGEPSAHIETLVVAAEAEGRGVGSALMDVSDALARNEGAKTITLHVFETNERARKLYERKGYSTEWLRYIKFL